MTSEKIPYTFSGLNYCNAKNMIDALFEEHVITIDKNIREKQYEVYLREKADRDIIKKIERKYKNIKFIIMSEKSKP